MTRKLSAVLPILIPLLIAQTAGQRTTLTFPDPMVPKSLEIQLLNGAVRAQGYDGEEVVLDVLGLPILDAAPTDVKFGLRPLGVQTLGEGNKILVRASSSVSPVNLTLQVPKDVQLSLRATDLSDLVLTNLKSDLEVKAPRASVQLTNILGSVDVYLVSGTIKALFNQVAPDKTMSFTLLSGDLDITLPADLSARLVIVAESADLTSDFPLPTRLNGGSSTNTVSRFRTRVRTATTIELNGGGPEYRFVMGTGRIFLRKQAGPTL